MSGPGGRRRGLSWKDRSGLILVALQEEGWTVQDDMQPTPAGMFAIGGFGDSTGGWLVYCKDADKLEASKRLKRVMANLGARW